MCQMGENSSFYHADAFIKLWNTGIMYRNVVIVKKYIRILL